MQCILNITEYPLDMTKDDIIKFKNTTKCYICKKKFSINNIKLRDHCHLIKKQNFRYALCNRCNLTYASIQLAPIPIVIHNLTGYDSHLLLSQIHKSSGKISIIPKNTERYLSFRIGNYQFIDSLAFLPAKLEVLVNSLKNENGGFNNFVHTKKLSKNESSLEYLIRKNIYPYQFATSLNDYNINGLPEKEAFINDIQQKLISDEEYDYAWKVFKHFKCKSFLDYHKLYLKLDVTLLADIFENYRTLCLESYGLDAVYYVSAAQLAFDGFLRTSNIQLECLSQMEMISFIEAGIRGGISVISKKHAKANNKFMGPKYDDRKISSYITYFDANGLYSAAMLSNLPYKNFKWVSKKEIKKFDIKSTSKDDKIGYILEVDLVYNYQIHDMTKDYPLAPEKKVIPDSFLSSHSAELKLELKLAKQNEKLAKLVPNLMDKNNYIVHYDSLRYYLEKGMILKKIHRILQFEQKAWLAPFVLGNMKRRQQAISPFKQLYFKTQLNACYGKLLESKRKRINLKIVTTEKNFDRLVAKPNFTGVRVFHENLAAITLQKENILLDRPIYAGFTILEISKIIMQKFYELFTQDLYKPEQVNLLMTDTDSLVFEIKNTDDIYSDLMQIIDYLDTSNYPEDHPLYSTTNRLLAGKFKDVYPPENIITEFCGLKSKMYSLKTINSKTFMKAKGINKTGLDAIKHKDYLNCLYDHSAPETTISNIRSFGHTIYNVQSKKSCLNAFDDKRYILENGVETLPFGHYAIP